MPSQWNTQADRDLLLAIIDEGALKSVLWPKIAEKMQAKGYSFSHEACRQHFQKIRKESKTSGNASPATSSTSTPRKRSANTSSFKSNKSSADNTSTSISDDDEEGFAGTPTKKQRVQKEVKIKEEVPYQPAYRFKAEVADAIVDLERDDLYEV